MPTRVPPPLVITAGFISLVLWPRVCSHPPVGRLAGEVLVTTLALSGFAYGLLARIIHECAQ